MYLPRELLSHLYLHLLKTSHALSPPVLILASLDADALCACRILTALLKRDFIPHKIQPVSGYADLARAGRELVLPMRSSVGGGGGVVVCLGLGATFDLEDALFSDEVDGEDGAKERRFGGYGGVECWVVDARRPWDLGNVFGNMEQPENLDERLAPEAVARRTGVDMGKVLHTYKPGRGGVVCFDDGDIESEMDKEKKAFYGTIKVRSDFPDFESIHHLKAHMRSVKKQLEAADVGADDDGGSDGEEEQDGIPDSAQNASSKKRKSWLDDEDDEDDEERPAQRRRSNSSEIIPSSPEQMLQRRNRPTGSSDVSRSASPAASQASSAIATTSESTRQLRRELRHLQAVHEEWQQHESSLHAYYALGSSYSEPTSSMMYSLASDLGREDNDLLWWAIVGVSSMELSGRTNTGLGLSPLSTAGGSSGWNGMRGERIRAVFRDEVRRLNPVPATDLYIDAYGGGVIQTHAKSPTDNAIRLSPEPRFLLIRHWSLYDSMLHSPYLSAKLHIWSDAGRRRLHKLLAKMGVSLAQCKQSYTHMDMDLKRGLREKLLKFAPQYGLEGLVPPVLISGREAKEGWGFVRCWGWKACLSAVDFGVVVGSLLEIGDSSARPKKSDKANEGPQLSYSQRIRQGMGSGALDAHETAIVALDRERSDSANARFWTAYDALGAGADLGAHISSAQYLHRAILRTGTSLIEKKQIRHLNAFRMAVVKEGPDVQLFTHPGALIKLALWIAEAVVEMEGGRSSNAKKGSELVIAALDEARSSYIVVGLGGGGAVALDKERQKKRAERRKRKEERKEQKKRERQRLREERRERRMANGDYSDSEDEEEDEEDEDESVVESEDDDSDSEDEGEQVKGRGHGKNRFGIAFEEVVAETGIRNRVDSFEHCVVQVRKEDLSAFLEALSLKVVIG